MTGPIRRKIRIPIRPELADHRFEGRPVYPAVEALETLAGVVRDCWPDAAVNLLVDIRFDRFLPVPEDQPAMEVLCDLQRGPDGRISAALGTRHRLPSGFSRTRDHVSAVFVQGEPTAPADRACPPDVAGFSAGSGFRVAAERLYRDLVPFGPGFRSLVGETVLFERGVSATVRCPRQRKTAGRLLGNAFVLDGALHAACAWGQRFAGIVAFPVGVAMRRIHLPTVRGDGYRVRAAPIRCESKELRFVIEIADESGRLRETVEGVRMRDVSGGRWKPPQWIRAA